MRALKNLSVGLIVGILLVGAPTVWGADKVIKIGQVVAKGHVENQMAEKFKAAVEAETSLKVQIYPGGQLGKYGELFQGIKMGAVQMATMPTSFMTPFYAPIGILDFPFLFQDYAHVDRYFLGPAGESFTNQFLQDTGVRVVGVFSSGFQGFYNSKKFIKNLNDMKGLKMRVMESPVLIDCMNAYGAHAVSMSLAEFYTAMQQGVVDGGENAIGTYGTQKHYEVAKYYTISDHKFLPIFFIMSEAFFKSLSAKEKEVVQKAGLDAAAYARNNYGAYEGEYKKRALAGGAQFTTLDPGADAAFIKALQPVTEKHAAKIKNGTVRLKDINALRK